jgi:dTDP-3-amino-3,4,6-trideoxy-alpha-D-glucopyranose N,N-dimethyltransferase
VDERREVCRGNDEAAGLGELAAEPLEQPEHCGRLEMLDHTTEEHRVEPSVERHGIRDEIGQSELDLLSRNPLAKLGLVETAGRRMLDHRQVDAVAKDCPERSGDQKVAWTHLEHATRMTGKLGDHQASLSIERSFATKQIPLAEEPDVLAALDKERRQLRGSHHEASVGPVTRSTKLWHRMTRPSRSGSASSAQHRSDELRPISPRAVRLSCCENPAVFTRSGHLYDAMCSFKDYAAESARVHELIQDRAPGAESLLDVACGTGKHLERLRSWYEAEGLDLDPVLLEIARDRLGGLPLHLGDMTSFELGRRFDAVTCLFSAIGYVGTVEHLNEAVEAMAAHLNPGGVLVVEPWLSPDVWVSGRPHLLSVDQPDLKLARMTMSGREGQLAILDFNYLVGTSEGVQHFTERHEAALFTDEEYRHAFVSAGLSVERDEEGLIGRGLYIGLR